MTAPACLPATERAIATAAEAIRAGQLIGFPTDTVYGLGADATNDDAVLRVFAAKGRPPDKPLIVLIASLAEAEIYADLAPEVRRAAAALWPGPLTLVLPRRATSPLSAHVNPAGDTIALRVPANAITRRLIAAAARPLTAPSANPSGAPPPTTADAVARTLGSALALVIDGGPAPSPVASTVIDLSGARPRLLREGAHPRETLERYLGPIEAAG